MRTMTILAGTRPFFGDLAEAFDHHVAVVKHCLTSAVIELVGKRYVVEIVLENDETDVEALFFDHDAAPEDLAAGRAVEQLIIEELRELMTAAEPARPRGRPRKDAA